MLQREFSRTSPQTSPAGARVLVKKLISAVSVAPWRTLIVCLAGILLAAVVTFVQLKTDSMPAAVTQILVAILSLSSWIAAIRFLLLDSSLRRVWMGFNLAALALVLFGSGVGLGFGITISVFFLTFRQYRPWRLVPDRRRAVGFALGLVAVVFLIFILRLSSAAETDGVFDGVATWALVSLTIFWVFSLFRLAINMRLHFLRLRPKLAVSAFLIGVVPVLALVVLGLIVGFSMLGASRSARLDSTLDSWREMTASGSDLSGALFDTTFAWPDPLPANSVAATVITPPDEVPALAKGMRQMVANAARLKSQGTRIIASDTTAYFVMDHQIWLMRWSHLDGESPRVRAWLVGEKPLRYLSKHLKTGLEVNASGVSGGGNSNVISTDSELDSANHLHPISVSYRDSDTPLQRIIFGATFRELLHLKRGESAAENEVSTTRIFMQLRLGWPDLQEDFIEIGSVNFLIILGIGLALVLFLIIEAFAIFFGVRISEGIVAGVHALHRGTRAVAAGNLQTVIEIPNEDEFGDLAASFNEMTLAVRHGREIALANDRLTQELATARSIQLRLLPSEEPRLGDFEIAGASIPSREIGGDYYDFIADGDDKIGIAIGDVSGKGMPAALLMSNLQASLHGQVLHPGTVAGVVERVNNLLVRSTDPHMFATFFYGLLDTATATFTCTNAGHNPPLLLRANDNFEELTTGGLLLGMLDGQLYKQDVVKLERGEVIVLYTDGITEAVGPSAEEDDPEAMFGEPALREVIIRNRHLPATGIKDAILAAVTEHTSGVAQSDDITLVVIRRQG